MDHLFRYFQVFEAIYLLAMGKTCGTEKKLESKCTHTHERTRAPTYSRLPCVALMTGTQIQHWPNTITSTVSLWNKAPLCALHEVHYYLSVLSVSWKGHLESRTWLASGYLQYVIVVTRESIGKKSCVSLSCWNWPPIKGLGNWSEVQSHEEWSGGGGLGYDTVWWSIS